MNLGLGHLTELKAHLLNAALRSSADYDAALTALGRGVAGRFDQFCNRKFARAVDATFETNADRLTVSLDRYPIESITRIEIRESLSQGWVDQGDINNVLYNLRASAGLADFVGSLSGRLARLRFTFTGGFWFATAPAIVIQTGSVTFAEGESAAAVAFDTAFDDIPAIKTMSKLDDASTIIEAHPYDATAQGFTIRLASPAASGGLTVQWIAVLGNDETDPSVLQSANVTLALNDESKAITFATAFDSAPIVICNILAPDGGLIIADAPTLVTASGFTASIGYPIPATGYKLSYIAVASAAAAAAQTLPDGATELPADLKLAWLLQCEATWQLRDKLGLDLGAAPESRKTLNLSSLELIPEVRRTLEQYIRYSA